MDTIKEYKKELIDAYEALPDERRAEIVKFYDRGGDTGAIMAMTEHARSGAQGVIHYADYKGYGYGEVGFNINEDIKEFAEDVPELEREYKHLINAYFSFYTESKNI